jgi:uncharacterized membrane protein YccC
VALFLGIYLMRVNYMFMVVGITVTMSQLYQQLNEFSWHLLTLRLAETAIGTGAVVVAVLLVFPLKPSRVMRAAALGYLEELQTLVDRAGAAITGTAPDEGERSLLRADVRRLDAAYHTLTQTARPLRSTAIGAGGVQIDKVLTIATAVRYYARNLAAGVVDWRSAGVAPEMLGEATSELSASLEAIRRRLAVGPGDRDDAYTRSASLFDAVDRQLTVFDEHVVLSDFMLLDATMARFAAALSMPVRDHDTATAETAGANNGAARPVRATADV